jgi:hypothetical protein
MALSPNLRILEASDHFGGATMAGKKKFKSIKILLDAEAGGEAADLQHVRDMLFQIIDYAVIQGAVLRSPDLIRYLELARIELAHWQPPCEECGRPFPR